VQNIDRPENAEWVNGVDMGLKEKVAATQETEARNALATCDCLLQLKLRIECPAVGNLFLMGAVMCNI